MPKSILALSLPDVVRCVYLKCKGANMSDKEFAMFLQLIAILLKDGKIEEVLRIIEKYVGEIESEPEERR